MESGVYMPLVESSLRPTGTSGAWRFDNPGLTRLRSALDKPRPASGDDESLRAQAARQLASLFVYQLLTEMRKTIPKSGLWNGGRAQEIYEQMIDERLADKIVATDQFGLAKTIHEQLLKYS